MLLHFLSVEETGGGTEGKFCRSRRFIGLFAFVVLFASAMHCFGGEYLLRFADYLNETDTNLIAISDWSEATHSDTGALLRARMLIFEEYPPIPPVEDEHTLIKVYVDLQSVTLGAADRVRIYFDISSNPLHWDMRDARGKPVPPNGRPVFGWAGPYPQPCWLTLPFDSALRLRANLNYGGRDKYGVFIPINGLNGGSWQFQPGDTNDYFIVATFTSNPPPNYVSTNSLTDRVWNGTVILPEAKLRVRKR
jgi:hypothetical protein